jgi:ribose transport system substrate-binding protein
MSTVNEFQLEAEEAVRHYLDKGLSRREIMKRTGLLVAAGAMAPILAACGSSAPASQAASAIKGKQLKMFATGEGLVVDFISQGKKVLEHYSSLFNVALTYADGELDPTKQRSAVDNAANQKWDIAAVTPVEAGTLVEPFRKMAADGACVLEQITPVGKPGEDYGQTSLISQDSFEMGFKVTTALCEKAGGKGGIIETRGPASHQGSIARHDGFTAALKNFPDMEVLETDFGNWDVQRVRQLWDSYVNRHANIAAGYFHNDDMAFAGLESLKAVGRTAAIGGCDGMPKAIQAVLDGTFTATMRHSTVRLNMYAVVIGQAFKRGVVTSVPKHVVIDGLLVTQDNAESLLFLQKDGIFLQ